MKLSVSRSGDADVYVNGQKIGSFRSSFTTRGFGGVLVRNGFNNIAEFRNFDIAPKLVVEVLPPRGISCYEQECNVILSSFSETMV